MPPQIAQATNELKGVYDPAIAQIQGLNPQIQGLYQTLLQGLQGQQQLQTQNVVNSAAQRGVSTPTTQATTFGMLGDTLRQQAAQLGVQQAQTQGQLGVKVGEANVGRVGAIADLAGALQKQSIEGASHQQSMTDLERKAQLEQQQNQQAFEIKRIQYQQAQARAARAAAAAAAGMDLEAFLSNTEASLKKMVGSDGNVSPDTFKKALALWTSKGLPESEFINKYSGFINRQHIQDYLPRGGRINTKTGLSSATLNQSF